MGRMKYLLTAIVYDGFGSIKGGNPCWLLELQPSVANDLRETMSASLLKVDLQGRRTQAPNVCLNPRSGVSFSATATPSPELRVPLAFCKARK